MNRVMKLHKTTGAGETLTGQTGVGDHGEVRNINHPLHGPVRWKISFLIILQAFCCCRDQDLMHMKGPTFWRPSKVPSA